MTRELLARINQVWAREHLGEGASNYLRRQQRLKALTLSHDKFPCCRVVSRRKRAMGRQCVQRTDIVGPRGIANFRKSVDTFVISDPLVFGMGLAFRKVGQL